MPITVRKQLLSTWVHTKRLLQQQIGQNIAIDDEVSGSVYIYDNIYDVIIILKGMKADMFNFLCFFQCKNEAVQAMSRVLVGVEMLRCNSNHALMEFSVPNLTMVRSTA